MVAAGADLRDGGAASFSVFDQPEVCDPRGAHGIAGCEPRPAGSAGRRIFPIQIEAAAEGAWGGAGARTRARGRGCSAGEPRAGARDEATGAAPWGEAVGRKPAGVPRRRGNGTATGAGNPAARRIRADPGAEPGWAAGSEDAGAATGYYSGGIAGGGDWSEPGTGDAGTSDCALRGAATSDGIFGAAGAGRQACDADRRYRIYWEGLVGEHADGVAED